MTWLLLGLGLNLVLLASSMNVESWPWFSEVWYRSSEYLSIKSLFDVRFLDSHYIWAWRFPTSFNGESSYLRHLILVCVAQHVGIWITNYFSIQVMVFSLLVKWSLFKPWPDYWIKGSLTEHGLHNKLPGKHRDSRVSLYLPQAGFKLWILAWAIEWTMKQPPWQLDHHGGIVNLIFQLFKCSVFRFSLYNFFYLDEFQICGPVPLVPLPRMPGRHRPCPEVPISKEPWVQTTPEKGAKPQQNREAFRGNQVRRLDMSLLM